jgi:hypothetical protein
MAKRIKPRIFILSPARLDGKRAELLLSDRAKFDLAHRLKKEGATLGEVFAFLSGLYFRGKLGYSKKFARPPRNFPGVLVITTNRGIIPVDTIVTREELAAFGKVPIDPSDARYFNALQESARFLAEKLPKNCEVVLLGSIGSKKYVELLVKVFGERLLFPPSFVGRGDMSRGGLMLRCTDSGEELEYVPLAGAVRHGKRPPRLEKRIYPSTPKKE